MTKSVASALVGIAVRDGSLALDDPRVPLRAVLAPHATRDRSRAQPAVQRQRPLLVRRVRLRQADPGADPHEVRRRARPAASAGARPGPTTTRRSRSSTGSLSQGDGDADGRLRGHRLFKPLRMTHTRMTCRRERDVDQRLLRPPDDLPDLARFAQLYLEKGTVGGKRILSASYVRASVGGSSTRLNAAYGYLWWLNRYGALRGATDRSTRRVRRSSRARDACVPGASPALFSAIGLRGQIAMVEPALAHDRGPHRTGERAGGERLQPARRREGRDLGAQVTAPGPTITSRARRAGAAAGCPRR